MEFRVNSGSLTPSLKSNLSISFFNTSSALSMSVPLLYSTVTIDAFCIDCVSTLLTYAKDRTWLSI